MHNPKKFLLWAALLTPLTLTAAPLPQGSPLTAPAAVLQPVPDRDDADEDSVVYHFDFEDGWDDWSSSIGYVWHTSETNAYNNGSSWWCGNEELGGYSNHWLQYLMTPAIDLSDAENATLTFKLYYAVEDPANGAPGDDYPEYDAWDGCNVWVSTDGGDSWEVLTPTAPEYDYESLFSFGWEWGMGPDIPGWCGSSDGWQDAEFDLGDYTGGEVILRWAFCSDPAWNTADDEDAIGYLVDELEVTADGEAVWSNNGDEQGNMELGEGPWYWERTDDDAHTGDYSAHCPILDNHSSWLISPPIEVPPDSFYTFFDFYVRCDARVADSDGDGLLDDYFRVSISENLYDWDQVVYDYADADHNRDWWDDFGYYGPGTFFRRDDDWAVNDWKWKLNLTPFAERTVYLMWEFRCDDDVEGNQGSGLYIDDVDVKVSSRMANDVGIDWVKVPHPNSIGVPTRCNIKVRNYGVSDQAVVRKYYQIDNADPVSINPPSGLDSDSSEVFNFFMVGIPYADTVTFRAWTDLEDDQNDQNDEVTLDNFLVYPPGIYRLGYDNRNYRYRFDFDPGSGLAVRFTPRDDGVRGDFDLTALRVRWNGEQNEDVQTTLHIYDDNRGEPGDEILSREITVSNVDVLPNIQVIDLTDVDELQGMGDDFWVWFEVQRDDHWPQIIGDTPDVPLTDGHYYSYDGETLEARDLNDFQVHAIVIPENNRGTNLTPGRLEVDFGHIQPGDFNEQRVALFNTGTTELTIEDIDVDNEAFELDPDFEFPLNLRIGDLAHLYVTFTPEAEQEYEGTITFNTNDQSPPQVRLLGVGDPNAAVGDEPDALPTEYAVGEAYPNPFNAATTIPYALPRSADVNLTVYDLAGRQVATLVSGRVSAGRHTVSFDGARLGTGVYIYSFEAAGTVQAGKMVLVK